MSNEQAAQQGMLLILSSPSGAGKTTLCRRLRARFPGLSFSVSHTTRPPRSGEENGREYHFVSDATFSGMIERGEFAEWAEVHGNRYGTSLAEIERAKDSRGILFDIDYQGARQIRACYPDAISVFILPPSLAELERRLRARGTEDPETATRRLAAAKREIEHYGFFDYVIVNDEVDAASDKLCAVVLAERSRRSRFAPLCEQLLLGANS